VRPCSGPSLHLSSVEVHGRVRVRLGTEGSRVLLDERKRIFEATREMVWPNPQLMNKLRHREAPVLPLVSLLAHGRSGAKVFCTCPITPRMSDNVVCALLLSCLLGFSPSSIKQSLALTPQLDGLSPSDETISHLCTASCFLPPTESLFPHSMYFRADRPREGIHGSLNPLAPCKEQGIQTASREPLGNAFFFTSSCLVFYLFILVWPFVKSGKG